MMGLKFKIGLCQLSVTRDKTININKARSSIEFASKQGATLVVLPEMWNCPYSVQYAENFDHENASSFKMLSEVARQERITIIGGAIPEQSGPNVYNTCCIFAPNGDLLAKHRKMHLFDSNGLDDIKFQESDNFSAGTEATIVDTNVGKIGIGICHDLRFPELAMLYRDRGVDLICYPGAFNMSTGEALWEVEQRARAVDNQLFVATCSPSRDSAGSYTIWGHSMLVDPLGKIIATCGHDETIIIGEVDYSAIQTTRKSIPILEQHRKDVYQFEAKSH